MDVKDLHIRARALLQIAGKPKEHVEAKLKEYIENIKENESSLIVSEKYLDTVENNGVWSTVAEIEFVVREIPELISFCIEYMPSSIEILKPRNFEFDDKVFTTVINDIISKLHGVDLIAKTLGTENTLLKNNMSKLIKNTLLVLIKFGVKNIEKMSLATGIAKEELKKFLKMLIDEKRIKEDPEGIYSLV